MYIAEIINKNTAPEESQFNDLSVVGDCLIDDLADYFEKEDKKGKECQRESSLGVKETYYINLKFDKQQFLKDCGVEE